MRYRYDRDVDHCYPHQQGFYRIGSLHLENHDETIIEELYLGAVFQYISEKKDAPLTVTLSTVKEKEISINRELLEKLC